MRRNTKAPARDTQWRCPACGPRPRVPATAPVNGPVCVARGGCVASPSLLSTMPRRQFGIIDAQKVQILERRRRVVSFHGGTASAPRTVARSAAVRFHQYFAMAGCVDAVPSFSRLHQHGWEPPFAVYYTYTTGTCIMKKGNGVAIYTSVVHKASTQLINNNRCRPARTSRANQFHYGKSLSATRRTSALQCPSPCSPPIELRARLPTGKIRDLRLPAGCE